MLVVDGSIADSAGTFYDPGAVGPSLFGFYARPRRGVTVDAAQAAVEAEVARLLKDGATADEVERAKKRMQAEAILARDSLRTGARVLGGALAIGLSVDDVEAWPERIGAVTVEQVNRAAHAVLTQTGFVTARLLPKESS
jgi:zinc protease